MEAVWAWGGDLIVAVQQISWLRPSLAAVTQLGSEEFFLLLMPALYWCWDAGLGRRVAVLLITSNALNNWLKLVFHQPRPFWVNSEVQALAHETSYGIPSAHGQHAVAVWGLLAQAARRRALAWALAALLIGLIAFSRIYLGQHFPTDVLGGMMFGAAALWAFLRWEAPATAGLQRLGLGQQLALSLLASALFLALALGTIALLAARPDPAEWEHTAALAVMPEADEPATDPRSPDSATATAGMLLGLGAGLACQTRWARFDARGPWGRRLARYLIGVAGVLAFWRGLALVFPTEPLAAALVFRYARYALAVFWVLCLAPVVFLRLRLAETVKE